MRTIHKAFIMLLHPFHHLTNNRLLQEDGFGILLENSGNILLDK